MVSNKCDIIISVLVALGILHLLFLPGLSEIHKSIQFGFVLCIGYMPVLHATSVHYACQVVAKC